jgi:hypothetical protein
MDRPDPHASPQASSLGVPKPQRSLKPSSGSDILAEEKNALKNLKIFLKTSKNLKKTLKNLKKRLIFF